MKRPFLQRNEEGDVFEINERREPEYDRKWNLSEY